MRGAGGSPRGCKVPGGPQGSSRSQGDPKELHHVCGGPQEAATYRGSPGRFKLPGRPQGAARCGGLPKGLQPPGGSPATPAGSLPSPCPFPRPRGGLCPAGGGVPRGGPCPGAVPARGSGGAQRPPAVIGSAGEAETRPGRPSPPADGQTDGRQDGRTHGRPDGRGWGAAVGLRLQPGPRCPYYGAGPEQPPEELSWGRSQVPGRGGGLRHTGGFAPWGMLEPLLGCLGGGSTPCRGAWGDAGAPMGVRGGMLEPLWGRLGDA